MAPALALEDVTKTYGTGPDRVTALDGVTLDVPAGHRLLLRGPSGSGKSTLLRLAGLLEAPTTGAVRLQGRDTTDLDAAQRVRHRLEEVGIVFQRYYLHPSLTAAENVALPALEAGADDEAARRRARDLLEDVGLADRADHGAAELSGGERQRVALARALVNDPALLLADEPTAELDADAASRVVDVLLEATGAETTLVVASHDPALDEAAHRTVRLDDGRLQDPPPHRPEP